MLRSLLADAAEQYKTEDDVRAGNRFQSLIRTRDESVLTEASRLSANKRLIKALRVFLAEDRRERSKGLKRKPYLNLNNEGRDLLLHLTNRSTLLQLNDEALRLHAMAQRAAEQLSDADQIIAAIPAEKSLAPILAEIEATKTAIRNAQVDLATVDVEIERLSRARERLRAQWLQQVESSLTSKLKNEDVRRLIIHSGRVRQTLNKFRVAVAQRHVKRVEQLVLDCFQQLLRKKSLISTLRIDPEQFSLQLLDADRKILSPDRLSAGERQLLAVSMLWGLARASGRPLPTIIDTPLGRLDASHRSNLVDRYFPYASHQVLLLSTDEEINKSHYRKLRPWIGRSYLLDYDDKERATTIKQGYFR
jgi:DNA sulfur modification protein DndD